MVLAEVQQRTERRVVAASSFTATDCPSTVTASMANDGRACVRTASANMVSPAAICRISGGVQLPQSVHRARLTPSLAN
jgi:hypothetical protein